MRNIVMFTIITMFVLSGCNSTSTCREEGVEYRRIAVNEYVDKMKAGWVGQMAGVGWGGRRNSGGRVLSFLKIRCRNGNRR